MSRDFYFPELSDMIESYHDYDIDDPLIEQLGEDLKAIRFVDGVIVEDFPEYGVLLIVCYAANESVVPRIDQLVSEFTDLPYTIRVDNVIRHIRFANDPPGMTRGDIKISITIKG